MYTACILYEGNEKLLKEYVKYISSMAEVYVGYKDKSLDIENAIKLDSLSFDELFDKIKKYLKPANLVLFTKDNELISDEAFTYATTKDILAIKLQCVKDYLNHFCVGKFKTGPFVCRAINKDSKDELYKKFETGDIKIDIMPLGYYFGNCKNSHLKQTDENSLNIKIDGLIDKDNAKKKLRIAFVDAAPGFGGGQTMAYEFYKLLRYDYDIHYFILSEKLKKMLSEETKNVFYMPNVNYFDFDSWMPYFQEQISKTNPDIIIINSNIIPKIPTDIPAIFYTHEILQRLEEGKYPTDIPYLNDFLNLLKNYKNIFVVGVSKPTTDYLLSKGAPSYKLFIIPNWINIPKNLKPRKYRDRFKVGWLARFEPEKGWRDLVEALKDTDIEVDFIGTGSDLEYAKKLKQEKHLTNMNFLGFMERDVVLDYLNKNCDIFVFTSHASYEALPLTLTEAMSVGLPVISHYIPASAYVLGDDGLFYKNIEELRELIFRLKTDKEFYEKYSAYSVERVKEFSEEKARQNWINVIEKLIKEIKQSL